MICLAQNATPEQKGFSSVVHESMKNETRKKILRKLRKTLTQRNIASEKDVNFKGIQGDEAEIVSQYMNCFRNSYQKSFSQTKHKSEHRSAMTCLQKTR